MADGAAVETEESGQEAGGVEIPLESEVDQTDEQAQLEAEAAEKLAEEEASSKAQEAAGSEGQQKKDEEKSRSAERIQELLAERAETRAELARANQSAEQRYQQLFQQQNQQIQALTQQVTALLTGQQRVADERLPEPERLKRDFIKELNDSTLSPALKAALEPVLREVNELKNGREQERAAQAVQARFDATYGLTKTQSQEVILKGLKPETYDQDFAKATADFILTFGAAQTATGKKVDIPSATKDFQTYLDTYYKARLKSSVRAAEGQVPVQQQGSGKPLGKPVAKGTGKRPVQMGDELPKDRSVSGLLDHFIRKQDSAEG